MATTPLTHLREVTAVVGPSSVGKSTYARRICGTDCELIDSDAVWFELAKRHDWDRRKVNAELHEEMIRRARRSRRKRVVLVDLHAAPLAELHPQVTFVLADLGALARNVRSRNDRRDTHAVLDGFSRQVAAGDKGVVLREEELALFPVRTRKDAAAVARFRKRFFRDAGEVRVLPTERYDKLVIHSVNSTPSL